MNSLFLLQMILLSGLFFYLYIIYRLVKAMFKILFGNNKTTYLVSYSYAKRNGTSHGSGNVTFDLEKLDEGSYKIIREWLNETYPDQDNVILNIISLGEKK